MDKLSKIVNKVLSEKKNKSKLCKKGQEYRKRRMAAGEKSSAYLSGRAVKVCKGQISGKSKKKKTNEAFDELDDGFDREMEALIKAGPRLNKDRFKDVIYYIHNNWMACNYGDDYAIRRISNYLNALEENIDPEAQKKHKGKSAPFGSAYQKVEEVEWVDESLRDWFKKEDWVRINTSGNITGPCGTMKKGKPTTRCLPRKKAQSLTKAQRKATVAKKVRGSKKGKQFVKNTKKSEFKK